MASAEIEVVKSHWETAARMPPPPSVTAQRAHSDYEWPKLTGEPRGIDVTEIQLEGRPALWLTPRGASNEQVILAFHGGGFRGGSVYTHRKLFGHLANAAGCRVLATDYRLAPEHGYPAAHDDAHSAYTWLTKQFDPRGIALVGDSAGGCLAVATALQARASGPAAPGALALISPWLDMTCSGESYKSNQDKDLFFQAKAVEWLAGVYVGSHDRRDPRLSPIFADLRNLPPTYVQVGGHEALLDDTRVFVQRAKDAGSEVKLDVFPEMLHTFQMAAGYAPEADAAVQQMGEWLRNRLGPAAS